MIIAHKHITVNIDIILTNILIQTYMKQRGSGGITHAQDRYIKKPI